MNVRGAAEGTQFSPQHTRMLAVAVIGTVTASPRTAATHGATTTSSTTVSPAPLVVCGEVGTPQIGLVDLPKESLNILSTRNVTKRQTCSHKERQGLVMEDDRTWTPRLGHCTLRVLTKSAGNGRLTGRKSPGAGSLVSLPSPGSVPCGLCDVE